MQLLFTPSTFDLPFCKPCLLASSNNWSWKGPLWLWNYVTPEGDLLLAQPKNSAAATVPAVSNTPVVTNVICSLIHCFHWWGKCPRWHICHNQRHEAYLSLQCIIVFCNREGFNEHSITSKQIPFQCTWNCIQSGNGWGVIVTGFSQKLSQ